MIAADDQVYQTTNRAFTVWKLKNDFAIYNETGTKIATIHGHGERKQRMAELSAEALASEFQR